MNRAALDDWLGRSVVRSLDGSPLVAWRGEHGAPCDAAFQTRHGSLSFGDRDTACFYAENPNDRSDRVVAPRVSAHYLRIERPVMNDPDDPFMDVRLLVKAIGREHAMDAVLVHADGVLRTGMWDEDHRPTWGDDVAGLLRFRPSALDDLYMPAYVLMDDHVVCARLLRAGYDGAVCGGWGENALKTEWRVIRHQDALPAWCWRRELEGRDALRAAA